MVQSQKSTKVQRSRDPSEDHDDDTEEELQQYQRAKKQKRSSLLEEEEELSPVVTTTAQVVRVKSKKEMRVERKRAKRAAEDPEFSATLMEVQQRALTKAQEREELKRIIREERNQTKLRQQKKLNRERNSPGVHGENKRQQRQQLLEHESRGSKESQNLAKSVVPKGEPEEDDITRKIINEIKYGMSDSSGWTTLPKGVKYKDIVVGKGPVVPNKSLVTVKYQLTGGKFGAVIDSSKNFKFRLGKGEVVQGWEIGIEGMREGGQRKLIVPPKAGYGSQDIGAGPGGLLYFDVTVLSFRQ